MVPIAFRKEQDPSNQKHHQEQPPVDRSVRVKLRTKYPQVDIE